MEIRAKGFRQKLSDSSLAGFSSAEPEISPSGFLRLDNLLNESACHSSFSPESLLQDVRCKNVVLFYPDVHEHICGFGHSGSCLHLLSKLLV